MFNSPRLSARWVRPGAAFLGLLAGIGLFFSFNKPPQEVAAALDNEPTRKAEIVIQSSKVSATLSDFPVLLTKDTIPSEACDADGTSPAQNGGGDIRFTSDAGGNTQLPLEVVDFTTDNNPENCTVEMYVKVPTVSSSTNTSIWMWYNTSSSDSQPSASNTYGSENVWDSNYKGVWHLDESSGSRSDSTSNANTLSDNNTVASGAGKWGIGADFETDNAEYFSRSDASQSGLDVTGDLTVSFWINPETATSWVPIVDKFNDASHKRAYAVRLNSNGTVQLQVSSNGTNGSAPTMNEVNSSTSVSSGWHYVTATFDPSTQMTMYIDGSQNSVKTTSIPTGIYNSDANFKIAATDHSGFGTFDGVLKAVRLSSSVRSADWISAEYNNQNDPNTFAVEEAPETASTAPNDSTVIKSSDESVASSTALQNDDNLTFALAANKKYVVSGGLFATSTSSQPNIKIGFTVPSGATMDIGYIAQGGNSRTAELLETSGSASEGINIVGNANTVIQPFGSVVTGGTAGSLTFQWSQNSSNATETTVKQGSFITVTEVTE